MYSKHVPVRHFKGFLSHYHKNLYSRRLIPLVTLLAFGAAAVVVVPFSNNNQVEYMGWVFQLSNNLMQFVIVLGFYAEIIVSQEILRQQRERNRNGIDAFALRKIVFRKPPRLCPSVVQLSLTLLVDSIETIRVYAVKLRLFLCHYKVFEPLNRISVHNPNWKCYSR